MRAFLDPYLVACQLPYRNVRDCAVWSGRGVRVLASRGVPHGYDRLVYLWAATMAHELGESFSFLPGQIPKMFGLKWSRDEVLQRLQRVWGAHLEAAEVGEECCRLMRRTTIESLEADGRRCRIRLGSAFVDSRLIPVRGSVVAGCVARRKLGALDLYLWQVGARRPACIEVFGEDGLLCRLSSKARDPRKARQQLRCWQSIIVELWPECPNHLSDDGNRFVLGAAHDGEQP